MTSPTDLLLCFAVKEESAALGRLESGRFSVRRLHTGIGARNAARALHRALDGRPPDLILTCGFAGGLNPALLCGQVICDAGAHVELGRALQAAGAMPARFLHSDRVVVTRVEKRQLRQSTGTDAVEMESSVIRQIAEERGLAVAILRVISDAATDDLPLDFNALMDDEHKLSLRGLMAALGRSPWKVGSLLRLQRQAALAARELAGVIRRFTTA